MEECENKKYNDNETKDACLNTMNKKIETSPYK